MNLGSGRPGYASLTWATLADACIETLLPQLEFFAAMDDVQKGNPHQLTRNQHIFPIASLKRYCNGTGTVQVVRADGKRFRCPPDNEIFGARRLWNQQAEAGLPKEYEDAFQQAAEKIIVQRRVDPALAETVSNFYALLHLRRYLLENPLEASRIEHLKGVAVEYTPDDRERLESKWITTITPEGYLDSQSMNGMMLTLRLLQNPVRGAVRTWGVVEAAAEHEFVVADRLVHNYVLPLSPNLLLKGNWPSQTLSAQSTRRYNKQAIGYAQNYYFGRNLEVDGPP